MLRSLHWKQISAVKFDLKARLAKLFFSVLDLELYWEIQDSSEFLGMILIFPNKEFTQDPQKFLYANLRPCRNRFILSLPFQQTEELSNLLKENFCRLIWT